MKLLKPWLPVIVWMTIIFYLSHQPSEASNELSTGLIETVAGMIQSLIPILKINIESYTFIVRKLAHLIAYFILGYLVTRALNRHTMKISEVIIIAFFICVLYALSDEVHQLFVPGRSGEVRDVLIDSVGAVIGIITYSIKSNMVTKH